MGATRGDLSQTVDCVILSCQVLKAAFRMPVLLGHFFIVHVQKVNAKKSMHLKEACREQKKREISMVSGVNYC